MIWAAIVLFLIAIYWVFIGAGVVVVTVLPYIWPLLVIFGLIVVLVLLFDLDWQMMLIDAGDSLQSVFEGIGGILGPIFEVMWTGIGWLGGILGAILSGIWAALGWIGGILGTDLGAVFGAVWTFMGWIAGIVGAIFSFLGGTVSSLIPGWIQPLP